MTTVAVLSLKGGVGKTTCVLGLAGAAWARNLSVLVVDADPQANATAALDLPPHVFSLGDVLADGRPGIAKEAVVPSGWGPRLHAVPSEEALAHRNRPEGPDSATRLRVSLTGVADRYDLVLIDCPPSLDELTRNALAAADGALVVTEPGFFALQGATRALAAVEAARDSLNLRLRPVGICVNRLRTQLSEHRYRLEELHMAFPDLIIDPPIPERSAVQQAQGASVPIQAWPSPGAREAVEAFDDVLDRVLR
ncbi:MAG: ParA family protein [Candidatus Nanopelagicales bacterium]|jgi:chromosome partitioning protein